MHAITTSTVSSYAPLGRRLSVMLATYFRPWFAVKLGVILAAPALCMGVARMLTSAPGEPVSA